MSQIRPLRAYAEVALGRQRSPVHESGPFMVPYLRAANVKDGILDMTDVLEMNFTPDEQSTFALADGDVLVTEGSGSRGSVGASAVWKADLPGLHCFQNTLIRLRPRADTEPRFLAWWARHAFASGTFASIATGANIFHLSAERVRSLPMTYLEPRRQWAIADYLDRETARIDALIAAKEQGIRLYEERRQAIRDAAFSTRPGFRLKHLLKGSMAYGVLVPEFVDPGTGVRMIRTYNLTERGTVDHADIAEITRGLADQYRRTYVEAGDVILSVVGSMGRAARVTSAEAGSNLNRPLARLRPHADFGPDLLWHWTQTTYFSDAAMLATGAGTAQPTLNLGDLANFQVGLPSDKRAWLELRHSLKIECERLYRLQHVARSQVDLLRERRQALITAAVTGQMRVPVAA